MAYVGVLLVQSNPPDPPVRAREGDRTVKIIGSRMIIGRGEVKANAGGHSGDRAKHPLTPDSGWYATSLFPALATRYVPFSPVLKWVCVVFRSDDLPILGIVISADRAWPVAAVILQLPDPAVELGN